MNTITHLVLTAISLIAAATWLLVGVLNDSIAWPYRLVMILIGFVAVILLALRDTYLPFLGKTAIPAHAVQVTPPLNPKDVNAQITLTQLPPNRKLIWWASRAEEESAQEVIPSPQLAYANSKNAGVVRTDANGSVTIHLQCPGTYAVRFGSHTLPKHIHYRYQLSESMFSRVFTSPVMCSSKA